MSKKIDVPLILLACAGFLAPLIGGYVSLDVLSLSPDSNAILSALTGAGETPLLSHAILALLCSAALATMMLSRKIVQVPNNLVGGLLMALLALILSTVGISNFWYISFPQAVEWISYGIAFYAVVAVVGRQRGPLLLLGAIFAGCVLLALLGIREYGDNKAIDPTWRIFPHWIGPNAMAAILLVGLILGLGLTINAKRSTAMAIGIGCVAIGLALFLTQSKGALLALVASVGALAVLLAMWLPKREIKRAFAVAVAPLAIIAVLCLAATFQSKAPAGAHPGAEVAVATPGARLLNAESSSDQSVGFRKLLWKTALKLVEKNPVGSGIGTFQFESARPGLITQTHFAHEAYLELAAEASPFAPLLLLAALACWTRLVFRGGAKLQPSQSVLRASVFAAVFGVAAHSLVDSDFSYYGVGLVIFMLLGVGLLLSSDAVAPEFLPAFFRRSAAVGVVGISLLLLYFGFSEAACSQARGYFEAKEYTNAQDVLASLRASAPWDADAWYLSAQSSQDLSDRLKYAKETVALSPNTKNLRMLARIESDNGMASDALGALQRALALDPNDLRTLKVLSQIQTKLGENEKADQTLRLMLDVEKTSYFEIKSLPELIETDTYDARIQLAANTQSPQEKIKLLQPAIDGFKKYLALTVPNVITYSKGGEGMSYGGETPDIVRAKMAEAASAAKDLAEAYRKVGDAAGATAAEADEAVFAKPLADLSSK